MLALLGHFTSIIKNHLLINISVASTLLCSKTPNTGLSSSWGLLTQFFLLKYWKTSMLFCQLTVSRTA